MRLGSGVHLDVSPIAVSVVGHVSHSVPDAYATVRDYLNWWNFNEALATSAAIDSKLSGGVPVYSIPQGGNPDVIVGGGRVCNASKFFQGAVDYTLPASDWSIVKWYKPTSPDTNLFANKQTPATGQFYIGRFGGSIYCYLIVDAEQQQVITPFADAGNGVLQMLVLRHDKATKTLSCSINGGTPASAVYSGTAINVAGRPLWVNYDGGAFGVHDAHATGVYGYKLSPAQEALLLAGGANLTL